MTETMDPEAFNAFEAQGWEKLGAAYETVIGRVTRRTATALLHAARVGSHHRLLDLATGPGYLAAEAAARGADVIGADIAAAMVELARGNNPGLRFDQADAEALPYPERFFHRVVANFGILHFGRPELAAAEIFRVLVPDGVVALTTWDVPQRCRLVGVLVEAMQAAGAAASQDIPAGPPFFRFADDAAFTKLLSDAGFNPVELSTITFEQHLADAEELWQGMLTGTVRNAAVLRSQSPETLQRIREELEQAVAPYQHGDHLEIPVSVKVALGRKP